ncbi:MAG: peptidyl-prolyl cis-trans isomerase [Myxococcota bacterium]
MRRLLREPLVQFLAIGLAIFALASLWGAREPVADDRIVVTEERVAQLQDAFAKQWRRPPSQDELRGLVDGYVREEALYREGVRMGLDRDDTIIRRRVAQKLSFLVEDLLLPPDPSDADLEAYLERERERFVLPGRVSFEHVYFSESRRGEAAAADARRVLAELRASADGDASDRGDPFMLGHRHEGVTRADVEGDFGPGFAAALLDLGVGAWQGPVRSAYGLHLVRVSERTPPVPPVLSEVRGGVLAAWLDDHRRRANEDAIARIVERYDVVLEEPGAGNGAP